MGNIYPYFLSYFALNKGDLLHHKKRTPGVLGWGLLFCFFFNSQNIKKKKLFVSCGLGVKISLFKQVFFLKNSMHISLFINY